MSHPDETKSTTDASPLSKGFTSWKFKILNGLISDPKIKSVDMHIASALLQRVSQHTRVAFITDCRLQQLVHKDRKAFMTARKRLVELGWLEVRTGAYGRATEYRFLEERADWVANYLLDQRIIDDEDEEDSNDAKPPHCEKPRNGSKTPHCKTKAKPPHCGPQWGENGTFNGEVLHPLHLNTPSKHTLPIKNITLGAHDRPVLEQHVLVYDAWHACEEEAGRLEFDELLPHDEATRRARRKFGFDDHADKWQLRAIA